MLYSEFVPFELKTAESVKRNRENDTDEDEDEEEEADEDNASDAEDDEEEESEEEKAKGDSAAYEVVKITRHTYDEDGNIDMYFVYWRMYPDPEWLSADACTGAPLIVQKYHESKTFKQIQQAHKKENKKARRV